LQALQNFHFQKMVWSLSGRLSHSRSSNVVELVIERVIYARGQQFESWQGQSFEEFWSQSEFTSERIETWVSVLHGPWVYLCVRSQEVETIVFSFSNETLPDKCRSRDHSSFSNVTPLIQMYHFHTHSWYDLCTVVAPLGVSLMARDFSV
jgi:hypothetical protein